MDPHSSGELKSSTVGSAPGPAKGKGKGASQDTGQTMVLTISNPTLRNALSPAMYAAGVEALNFADSSDEIRSVVITGEGSMFCAGGNLQRLLDNRSQAPDVQAQSIDGLHSWIEAIRSCRGLFAVPGLRHGRGRAGRGVCHGLQQCRLIARRRRYLAPGPHAAAPVSQ
jgi:hypothetical protein